MPGVLLDTHALIWLYDPAPISLDALLAVERASQSEELYVSPVTAWELGAASRKKNPSQRPSLRGMSPDNWFVSACNALGAKTAPISGGIGLAASVLPDQYGHADPGDCFLIATAHVLQLTLITRDQRILDFAQGNPTYLSTIRC